MSLPKEGSGSPGPLVLRVWLQPGASQDAVVGWVDRPLPVGRRLALQIQAPPVEGAANEALLRFLKERLRGLKLSPSLVRGETSRAKDVLLSGGAGVTLEQVMGILLPRT